MDGADAGALRDAMMITAAQKVEHYEIATYGTVRTYASLLGEHGVTRLLGPDADAGEGGRQEADDDRRGRGQQARREGMAGADQRARDRDGDAREGRRLDRFDGRRRR